MRILLLYHSKTGHTLEAANATAEGIRTAGAEADIIAATDFEINSMTQYDGLILASPCWAGSVTGSGIAKPIKKLINDLPVDSLKGRRCGGISVHSKTGGENTVKALGKLAKSKGCSNFSSGPAAKAGVALSLWKGPSVSPNDIERYKAYGAEFAT